MFRAIAGLLFIVLILPIAAFAAFLIMSVLGVDGLLGFIVGFPVFVGILTAAVMILSAINDRMNDRQQYEKSHNRTRVKGAH